VALFRSYSEIVNSMTNRLKLTQPNLDTKPGTVASDLFIDIQAEQLENLHKSLILVSEKQSPEKAVGKDLERWARNFGITKKVGTPSSGLVVFTIDDLTVDISIPNGTIVTARNGLTFRTIGGYLMSSAEKNKYSATANRLRKSLNLAGINDSYAIEIPVEGTRAGTFGNISTFQIITSNVDNSAKVTNISAFKGGANNESDNVFRSRIFAIFGGSNTGTSSGYRNAALAIEGVLDVLVVEPGNALMKRDGTETIEVNNNEFRILNSGSGGKVDLYILGTKLQEILESFIFTDLSGTGDVTDERNNIIPGLQGIDRTLTSEERRVSAFKTGAVPLQPVSSIVSVTGSSSGILAEASLDLNGDIVGNYQLEKDYNTETGGSPFGFDKISFASNTKDVIGEAIVKKENNSIEPLRFSEINMLKGVYEDIQITGENSSVSSADRSILKLSHKPITNITNIVNETTGEIYSIVNSNIDNVTGLNASGNIKISGKTLPTSSDILNVDYIWRLEFDKRIDYNGVLSPSLFSDSDVSDSIDWGASNGIRREIGIIEQTDDDLEYQITTDHNISRIISVFSALQTSAEASLISVSSDISLLGLVLSSEDSGIKNIESITDSGGLEVYKTIKNDGTFSGKTIYFPSDTPAVLSGTYEVIYNKTELYNIENTDGSFGNNILIMPSSDILEGSDVLDIVDDLFLTEDDIYIDYIANISEILPSQSLTSLPIEGLQSSNLLTDSSLSSITGSAQPIFYSFDGNNSPNGINRFGPGRVSVNVTGSVTSGKIKIAGETLTRAEFVVYSGISMSGLKINLRSEIKEFFGLKTVPSNIGIGRVDSVSIVDSGSLFDISGYKLLTNIYDSKSGSSDSSLSSYEFTIPSTETNGGVSLSSGQKIKISVLIYNTTDFEDLFFREDGTIYTDKVFGRISTISVSSGFRNPIGTLVGSVSINIKNQPENSSTYFSDYNFKAPKEGERLTVRYNLNRLITDVTSGLEDVRSITADVLAKEAFDLPVDVEGQILINDNTGNGSSTIKENVENAIVNLLNTGALGGTIDYSDIISAGAAISGVDSINVSLFNKKDTTGRRTYIRALDNEVISANSVIFNVVSRQNFRIT
jgi:uncharacterized phage protein gp47/JayE